MRRTLISAAVLTLTLTACGGGDSGGSGSEGELRDSAEEFFTAFFEPDVDTVYDLLSERCQGVLSKDEMESTLDLAQTAYGKVEVEIKSVEVDGDKGTVDGETGIPALDEGGDDGPQWVFEDGGWKSDACD